MAKSPTEWALPWIPPTQEPAVSALAQLARPLAAWCTGQEFDGNAYYSQFSAQEMTSVERAVRRAGRRPEWRFEETELPDNESQARQYDRDRRLIAGRWINPLCLDEFRFIVDSIVGDSLADPDLELPDDDFNDALAWAEAAVCVVQQSLPYPFIDCLPYGYLGNRPVHDCWFTYASLLSHRHPRKAARWFRGLVFANPTDNLGARFFTARAPRDLT